MNLKLNIYKAILLSIILIFNCCNKKIDGSKGDLRQNSKSERTVNHYDKIDYMFRMVPSGGVEIELNLKDQTVKCFLDGILEDSIKLNQEKINSAKSDLDSIKFNAFKDSTEAGHEGAWHSIQILNDNKVVLKSKVWSRYCTKEHIKLWNILYILVWNNSNNLDFKAKLKLYNSICDSE